MKKANAERRQRIGEIQALLHQSNISSKNLTRLGALSLHADTQIATLARLVLEVVQLAPQKQDRWLKISSSHPKLFENALALLGQKYFDRLFARPADAADRVWPILTAVVRSASSQPNHDLPGLPPPLAPQRPSGANETQSGDRSPRPHVEIYTDGGCDPNPGRGGYGVVLVHPRKRVEASGAFRLTTNNRMELLAVIKGLEMLKRPCAVTVYSDSQYLVKAMTQGWAARWKRNGWRLSTKEPAKNIDLWDRLLALTAVHRVQFRWIRGHAGHRENERCDSLCATAKQQKNLPPDLGYERAGAASL